MFDPDSRYASTPIHTLERANADPIPYIGRRFLPRSERMPELARVEVMADDRIDLITNRTLGDPLQFWRVADANNAMDPGELTEEPGRVLRIATPQP